MLPRDAKDFSPVRVSASAHRDRYLTENDSHSVVSAFLEHSMTQTIEAIYTDGVLKPTAELHLRDNQRVRLTVEMIEEINTDREAAVARLKAGIASMRFFLEEPRPSREKLHDCR
jgi:predicted DNA-binding antitoxin AbrB/MazE fold protein